MGLPLAGTRSIGEMTMLLYHSRRLIGSFGTLVVALFCGGFGDRMKGESFLESIERYSVMHRFSREAIERPARTLQAVEVLREKAGAIVRATADAREDEIVVAVVQPDLGFGGVWTLAREDFVKQVLVVEEEGGWSFTFSANTSDDQVEERCSELTGIVRKRGEAMQRWASRHLHDAHE